MDRQQIKNKIKELGDHPHRFGITKKTGWYQQFNLYDNITVKRSISSIITFRKLLSLFDFPVRGLRVLDIGCNAGLNCVEAATLGMSCVGIEQKKPWLDQAYFVKDYYEQILGSPLDITYIQGDLKDFDLTTLGLFDFCLAIGVLTELALTIGHKRFTERSLEEQSRLLSILPNITNNVIISTNSKRKNMTADFYADALKDHFSLIDQVRAGNLIYIRLGR